MTTPGAGTRSAGTKAIRDPPSRSTGRRRPFGAGIRRILLRHLSRKGRSWRLCPSTAGGISQVKLQNVHGTLKYTVEAYGDLSRATDPNMSIQFYVANQQTPAIHTQAWQKTSNGWTCHSQ